MGDCGTSGSPNESGEVEIGYGLAPPCRGRGYATEAAGAVCRWLFTQAEVALIRADGVRVDNIASRRVLERLGFTLGSATSQHVSYKITRRNLR